MKHAWLYSDLLKALKGKSLNNSGFSTDVPFISASAEPRSLGVRVERCSSCKVDLHSVVDTRR